jgi:NTE family protein
VDLTALGGLDRYQSLTWEIVARDGSPGLLVRAHPKSYGPPFVFLGVSLENTTSNEFRFGLSGRFLAYDVLGSASELRVDGAVGSDPSAAVALYRPVWSTPFFVEPFAGIGSRTFNVVAGDRIVAAYRQTRTFVGAEAGINVGRVDDVRVGARLGRLDADVRIGDPGLPAVAGAERSLHVRWTHDGQDSAFLPSTGLHLEAGLQRFVEAPPIPADFPVTRTTEGVTQATAVVSWMRSLDSTRARRMFVAGGGGTSFDGHPLPIDQFALGGPLRLSGFSIGERRGDHYWLAASGYLHQVARLPDFFGGPIFVGGTFETGATFDRWADADVAAHASVSLIADTLIGPVLAGVGAGFDGSNRFYIGVGRIFR